MDPLINNSWIVMNKYILLLVMLALAGYGLSACNQHSQLQTNKATHKVDINWPDGSRLYIDKVDPRSVMQITESDSLTTFCCYKIGMTDSISYNKEQELEWNKYFNFGMQNDWLAMINGDSLAPVFLHPILTGQKQKEAVLVFEIPAGKEPDTLVFKRSYGLSSTPEIILLNTGK